MAAKVFLSILIPVYNWDLTKLLRSLADQCAMLENPGEVEIIVVDDGSNQKFSNKRVAEESGNVRYTELQENTGRSAVRNSLIERAGGEYVLFLDADMLPDHETFVQTYLDLARQDVDIVCGGISYRQISAVGDLHAFYVYKSSKTEALPAEARRRTPWRYVFTSNILLRRDIAMSVRFDSRFVTYGFEDIEWGIRLSRSYKLIHIDNTCTHMGIMDKQQVFDKMRQSIDNQFLLYSLHPEIGAAGALGPAMYLRHLPQGILFYFDKALSYLFQRLSWNPLVYLVFQAEKGVLLAGKLKERKTV